MNSLFERSIKVMPPVANRATKLGIVKGEGCYLIDEDGRKILDFASGVAVCNIGHNHPKVMEAATKQIQTLIHGGHNVVYYESYVRLAEKLVEISGNDNMVYFSNSGAEANEGAMKLAKYITKRPAIIAFTGSFHGRTIGTISITASNSAYRKNYEGLLPSVYFAEYPYLYRSPYKNDGEGCPKQYFKQFDEMFKKIIDPYSVAAIIMEPIQGEGGYIVPPVEFIKFVRSICDKYGIMLIFDEIQTGFGRTGKMFAKDNFEVEPDIFSVAKGIASGFPLSAVIAKREHMEKWVAGAHGGTFGGNPVACAAALATIEVLENGALDNCVKMGEYFKNRLFELQSKHEVIGDVRGVGLMLAIEIVDKEGNPNKELTSQVVAKSLEQGLLLLSCGCDKNVIRFIAPTIVGKEEIDFAVEMIDNLLKENEAR